MRHLFSGILFLLLWNIYPAVAQDRFAGIENSYYVDKDLKLPASRFLGTLRFRELYGGIIIGKVQLGDFPDSLSFIFDTGCGGDIIRFFDGAAVKIDPVPHSRSDSYIRGDCGGAAGAAVGRDAAAFRRCFA